MQVDPQQVQGAITVTAPAGGAVALEPGKSVVARVLEVSESGGGARISLAGHAISVQTDQTLQVGQTLNLTVASVGNGSVRLVTDAPAATAAAAALQAGADPLLAAGGGVSAIAPRAVSELARAGVPVTADLVRSVAAAVEKLTAADAALAGSAATATRAVAELAARGIALDSAAATRVAAALDLSGKLGSSLTVLAGQSPEIAAALPAGSPDSAALKSLLASSLSPAELAVARIAQAVDAARSAQVAAPGGPVTLPTPPSSAPNVIANYVASQVAVTTQLDELAHASALQSATPPPAAGPPNPAALDATATGKALAAAIRGAAPETEAASLTSPAALAAKGALVGALAAAPAATANAQEAATAASRGGAQSAATAAATVATAPAVAVAVADLSVSASRFIVSAAPAAGVAGDVAAMQGRALAGAAYATNSAGQNAPASAKSEYGGVGPLIAAMKSAISGSSADLAHLNSMLANANREDVAAAMSQLPESETLQLAGRMLGQLGTTGQNGQSEMLRHALDRALTDLGSALRPPSHADTAALAAALRHVAESDTRPAVADMAGRLMNAADGQLILSQPRAGMDPGYVYFQMPMPGQRSAEVIVRREPGRRVISSEQFNIAFLLDTESLGTLMIQLDGHPASVRAHIKTDTPALEPFLALHADELSSAVARETGRPISVSTGVFDNDTAPTSLLSPSLGLIEPGAHAYYA